MGWAPRGSLQADPRRAEPRPPASGGRDAEQLWALLGAGVSCHRVVAVHFVALWIIFIRMGNRALHNIVVFLVFFFVGIEVKQV